MAIGKLIVAKTKFLTTIDDYIRLVTMTFIAFLIAKTLNLSGFSFAVIVAIGIAIDIHDVVAKIAEGKPLL